MIGSFAELSALIEQAGQIEKEWLRRRAGQRADQANTAWMPFPLFDFIAMLAEATPMIPDASDGLDTTRILDVGAGPGSKMLLMRDWFGLDAHGIEVDEEMAAAARELGLAVETADVTEWAGYGKFEAVWLNRPLRDPAAELALETRVWLEMNPGAVVLCANLESPPPSNWFIILDAWQSDRRGVWLKPFAYEVSAELAG